jgi:flagellar hook-associated protein 2
MAGEISSLGIGSGVLTAEIIDKLKANDESRVIKPIEDKITLANQKEDAYNLLSTLMNTFKSSASALDGDNLYLGRAVNGSTDALTVTAESGADVQSFSITDIDKAEKDVWNSAALDAKSTAITGLGSGILTLSIDGEDFTIDYAATDSLNQIRDNINEAAGEKVTASVLQVGIDSYELVITSNEVNQAMTFSDSNAGIDSLSNILSLNNIQPAKPATFKYNGIEITRSSNEISDLINGVTLTLNQNQAAEDSANISISQNDTAITSEMSIFVQNYNNLVSNLQDMTTSDTENGTVGVFNGESFIKSITRELNSIIFNVSAGEPSLVDYGINIDRDGVMSFDSSVFSTQFSEDPTALELFFSGDSETDGLFTKLNDKMTEYTGYNQLLSNFSDSLESSKDALVSQYDKLSKSIDDRYAIMTKRFTAYDAIISKINTQFSSLEMMINAELNADS